MAELTLPTNSVSTLLQLERHFGTLVAYCTLVVVYAELKVLRK